MTADVDGHMYEMGGTWVHWSQPFVWREMMRYGLHRDFVRTSDATDQSSPAIVDDKGDKQSVTLETFVGRTSLLIPTGEKKGVTDKPQDRLASNALKAFFNVDGEDGREVLPFPHDALCDSGLKGRENLSCADRLDEIRSAITPTEMCVLKAFLETANGDADMGAVGFLDVLCWWGLSGYTTQGFYEHTEAFKIKEGQTHFALQFFNEALSTGRLAYAFQARVGSVVDDGSSVSATLEDGRRFCGRKLISTLPLNVLRDVKFAPQLSILKDEASSIGHAQKGAKIHYQIGASETRPLSALCNSDSRIVRTLGDGRTESSGCRHMVAFGRNDLFLDPLEDAKSFHTEALKAFPGIPVKRLVCLRPQSPTFSSWTIPPCRNLELSDANS